MEHRPSSRPALLPASMAVVALLIGIAIGWAVKPEVRKPLEPFLGGILESLDDVQRRTAAVVEILNDMAGGRVSSDPASLNALRDSMQEITEELGDMHSQLLTLRR